MEYNVQSLGPSQHLSIQQNVRNRKRKEALWGYFFILPQMIGLLAFAVIPLVVVFYLSLTTWDGLGSIQFVGLQNFIEQLKSDDLRISLLHTLLFTLIVVPGGLFLALMAALGLDKVRGKDTYRVLYFMPVVTGPVAIAVMWAWLLNSDYGLLNTLLRNWFRIAGPGWLTDSRFVIPSIAMVSIWGGLGFNMIIFLAGLQSIPTTYSEAARIDGASKFQLFWRVTLPLLTPTIFFTSVISVINSFQSFDLIYVLTGGGPGKDSYTIVYYMYHMAFEQATFGSASAVAVILFAILLSLTLLQFQFQRRWVHYEL